MTALTSSVSAMNEQEYLDLLAELRTAAARFGDLYDACPPESRDLSVELLDAASALDEVTTRWREARDLRYG